MRFSKASAVVILALGLKSSGAALERRAIACPVASTGSQANVYDYIIVGGCIHHFCRGYPQAILGAGAGGGPLAARLALAGYKVLLLEHGRDVVNYNTTVPLYLGKASDDPQLSLDYNVTHNAAGTPIVKWYPRGSGLGGSTIHNALVNLLQVDSDWNTISKALGDTSWDSASMRKYFVKLENNLYLNQTVGVPAGHGYGGWLSTDYSPSNILTGGFASATTEAEAY